MGHALLGRIPNGLEGWWGGDADRRLIYGSRNGSFDLEKWLGVDFRFRTGFTIDRDHVESIILTNVNSFPNLNLI